METYPWWAEEQKAFEEEMQAFTKEFMPKDEETKWRSEFPWDIFEKIAKKKYNGAAIPKEYGGLGLGASGACTALEALRRMPGVGRALVASRSWEETGRHRSIPLQQS
jgi:alkylation response protein AidB-like acyl-CoA dehydrogenase